MFKDPELWAAAFSDGSGFAGAVIVKLTMDFESEICK
jgi:hypothetical protein